MIFEVRTDLRLESSGTVTRSPGPTYSSVGGDIGVRVAGGATIVARGFASFPLPGSFRIVSASLELTTGTISTEVGKTLFDLAVRCGPGLLPDAFEAGDPATIFAAAYPRSLGLVVNLVSHATFSVVVPVAAISVAARLDVRFSASGESAGFGGNVSLHSVVLVLQCSPDLEADATRELGAGAIGSPEMTSGATGGELSSGVAGETRLSSGSVPGEMGAGHAGEE